MILAARESGLAWSSSKSAKLRRRVTVDFSVDRCYSETFVVEKHRVRRAGILHRLLAFGVFSQEAYDQQKY